mmetsp:Transcript_54724/g.163590  ORF Transcript_54724/g.163590 Transcript_54724/m.163590 type:complete len:2342 (-) Transcript_54724:20-7045(-)
MSSTTGLLTLSVHEALTFDGAEIAIHPDLFATGSANGGGSGTVGMGSPDGLADDAASVATVQLQNGGGGGSVAAAPSPISKSLVISPGAASVMSSATHQTASAAKQKLSALAAGVRLKVGDLIEVRVWDAKPRDRVVDSVRSSNERGATMQAPKTTAAPLTIGISTSRVAASTSTPALTAQPTLPPSVSPSSLQTLTKPSNDADESLNSDQVYGIGIQQQTTPMSVDLGASTSSAQLRKDAQQQGKPVVSQPQPPLKKGQQQKLPGRRPSPPDSPATSQKSAASVAANSSDGGYVPKIQPNPSSAAAANAAAATLLAAAAASSASPSSRIPPIPMRRDGSGRGGTPGSNAGVVEPRDIRAPRLSDSPSPPVPAASSGRKTAAGGGGGSPSSLQSTNPQEGGSAAAGRQPLPADSASSSLSSSPVQRGVGPSVGVMAGVAPPPHSPSTNLQFQSIGPQSELPPRAPMIRNRSLTGDSTDAQIATSPGLLQSSSAAAAATSAQPISSFTAKATTANQRHVRSSSSVTPGTMPSIGSGAPAGDGGSTFNANSWKNWGRHSSQPIQSTTRLTTPSQTPLNESAPVGGKGPSSVPATRPVVAVPPLSGHVRHDSKLSVTSVHIWQSSTASSVLGEQLLSPSISTDILDGDGSEEMNSTPLPPVGAVGGAGGGSRSEHEPTLRAAPTLQVGVKGRPPPHPFARMPAGVGPGNAPAAAAITTSSNGPPSKQPQKQQQQQTHHTQQQGMHQRLRGSHDLRLSFVMIVTERSLTSVKTNARTQVSILRQVADLYDLSAFDMLTVTKIDDSERQQKIERISADFVTVTIKDQFISRGEMFLFQKSFLSRWIYEGERLDSDDGVRANAMEIRHANRPARSGIVTDNTKITFRTRSARIIWLVQISSDMWDYASPYEAEVGGSTVGGDETTSCDIYFDKFVSFMYRLFEKWKDMEVSHSLTVVFFSRTYLKTPSMVDAMEEATNDGSAIRKDCDGRLYEDHYKMVIENETRADWSQLVQAIKKEFVSYPSGVGWDLSPEPELGRVPSTAAQGNLLEAINITLNLLQFHYMDRDLRRVGNSIVIVSAGCGVFEVNKGLASITKQRMMDNGIGSDMLSLGLPPLHVAPFFLYKDVGRAHTEGNSDFDDWKTYFEIPHWMHLSYVSYDRSCDTTTNPELSMSEVSTSFSNHSHPTPVRFAANGFMVREAESIDPVISFCEPVMPPKTDSTGTLTSQFVKTHAQKQQRHLISGREFEDILEACRPRNRGDTIPSSLVTLLQKSKISKSQPNRLARKAHKPSQHTKAKAPAAVEHEDSARNSSGIKPSESTVSMHLQEWGAVNFDDFGGGVMLRSKQYGPPKIASCHKLYEHDGSISPSAPNNEQAGSGSEKSSPSSSFASHYSFLLGRSPEFGDLASSLYSNHSSPALHGLMLQPSLDLDIPLLSSSHPKDDVSNIARPRSHHSDDSLSTMCSGEFLSPDKDQGQQVLMNVINGGHHSSPTQEPKAKKINPKKVSVQSLENLMSKYDASLFQPAKKEKKTKMSEATVVGTALPGSVSRQDHPPVRIVNARGWNMGSQRILEDAEGTNADMVRNAAIVPPASGIGAALVQHSISSRPVHPQHEHSNVMLIGPRRPGVLDRTASAASSRGGRAGSFGPLQQVSPVMGSLGMPMGSDPPERIRLPAGHNPTTNLPYTGIRLLQQSSEKSTRASTVGFGQSTRIGSLGSAGNKPTAVTSSRLLRHHSSAEMVKERCLSPSRNQTSPPKKSSHRHGHHHHRHHGNGSKDKLKKKHARRHLHAPMPPSVSTSHPRRKAWVLNPFRQQDEEEVLAKRTHNRRRWSHVFPLGEVEFKRHAGPNWKSLCQPAILPATIDYFPSKEELSDPTKYQFSHYEVTLDAMDRTYYKSHSELLREMVTQRLIQDFQIVPQFLLMSQSTNYGEMERKTAQIKAQRGPMALPENMSILKRPQSYGLAQPKMPPPNYTSGSMQCTLSMGHRIHSLSYNPTSDAIEVVQYVARFAQNVSTNIVPYKYLLWCPAKKCYTKVVQKFSKYSEEYMWNRVDNLICGDQDKKLTEGTRFRRIMFRIIPDQFTDIVSEQEYVKKFQGLLDYLSKKLLKEPAVERDIKIVTTSDPQPVEGNNSKRPRWRRADPFKYFTIKLNKGSEHYQWIEWVMDAVFDTQKTYKIMLHWLVANAVKVEAQVNLLQRRCSQFGLRLVGFPQDSISANVYLHPFIAPIIMPVRNKDNASVLERALVEQFGFIDDDNVMMDAKELDGFGDYTFPVSKFRRIRKFSLFPTKQVVHNTGTVFVRVIRDEKGWGIFILHENRRYICGDNALLRKARDAISAFQDYFSSVVGNSVLNF